MADPFKHTRDLRRAFGLISVVPPGCDWLADRGPQVAGWFPWVGLSIGLITLAPLVGLSAAGILSDKTSGVFAALTLLAWAALTRLLHWDGLADTADGLLGSPDVPRRLEIMSDSLLGAFGVSAVVFAALLEYSTLASLLAAQSFAAILWATTVSRLAPTFAAWLGKPARPNGLGAAITGKPRFPSMIAAALALGIGAAPMFATSPDTTISSSIVVVTGIGSALVVPHVLSSRVGGVTGDLMGASVLVTEVVTLVAAVVAGAVGRV